MIQSGINLCGPNERPTDELSLARGGGGEQRVRSVVLKEGTTKAILKACQGVCGIDECDCCRWVVVIFCAESPILRGYWGGASSTCRTGSFSAKSYEWLWRQEGQIIERIVTPDRSQFFLLILRESFFYQCPSKLLLDNLQIPRGWTRIQ